MSRRSPTTSQLIAWSVPFLLVLMMLPETPRVITTVQDHWLDRPVTTIRTTRQPPAPGAKPLRDRLSTTRNVNPLPTNSSTATSSTVAPSAAPLSGANSSSGRFSGTVAATTVAATTKSGVLEAPFTVVDEPLALGTNWLLSADAAVSVSLECDGVSTAVNYVVAVPINASSCALRIAIDGVGPVTWKLTQQ